MQNVFFLLLIIVSSALQAQLPKIFNAADQPSAPDYSLDKYWSSLPFRKDAADVIPNYETWIPDSLKNVDVFYIYPTIYQKGNTWNADLDDKALNKKIDNFPVKFQATAFNQIGRVYVPRYRQAIIQAYYDSIPGTQALDFAYEDVKQAFQYYLDNYNDGRPIIIASHSQGTTHSRRLIKDFFDNSEMKEKLVCAYIVGFAVFPSQYQYLRPCEDSLATNCYVTWASFKDGYHYNKNLRYFGDICVNPISWTLDTLSAESNGSILLSLNKKKPFRTSAYRKGNYLMVRTKTPIVQTWNNLHLVDFNLFWHNIRTNAKVRVGAYFKQQK